MYYGACCALQGPSQNQWGSERWVMDLVESPLPKLSKVEFEKGKNTHFDGMLPEDSGFYESVTTKAGWPHWR